MLKDPVGRGSLDGILTTSRVLLVANWRKCVLFGFWIAGFTIAGHWGMKGEWRDRRELTLPP